MSINLVELQREARKKYVDELVNIYRERGKNLDGRKIEFIRNDTRAQKDLAIITITGGACGAIGGGVIGAIAGGVCGSPGGPPGMAFGAIVGAPVGFFVGGLVGGAIGVAYVYPRYTEWLKTENGKLCAGAMRVFLADDKILQHYNCGITLSTAVDAVRTPQGQIYERSAIVAWVEKNGIDPITRKPLRVSDLIDDNDSTLESSKRLAAVIEEMQEHIEANAPELMDGLQALNEDLQARANHMYNTELVKLQKKLEKREISPQAYRSQAKSLADKYHY